MKNSSFYKTFNYYTIKLKSFYQKYKFFIYLFIVVFILGIILGCSSTSSFIDDISVDYIKDKKIIEFITKECSFFGLCINQFLKNLILTFLIMIICGIPYIKICTFLFIVYFGFNIGIDIIILYLQFGFFGLIHIVICYIPLNLLIIVIHGFIFSMCYERSEKICRNNNYFNFDIDFIKKILILITLLFFICLFYSLISCVTTATFVLIV